MKKILITGCNGQLGRALNQIYHDECLINTDVTEGEGRKALDITDVDAVLKMVREEQPDVIINCAAHTAVELCESQEDLAYRINAIGARNLSIAAAQVDAKLIQVSTDYVFDGNATRPYTEFDEPCSDSVYGKTKLEGERFVKEFAPKHFILRTAWLYGDGKNFLKTMLRLSETNQEVKVVNDQFGNPTSAKELARLIHFLEPGENYGTFHATCEGQCSWADFAAKIFEMAGKATKVIPISTEEYNAGVKRPAYSVLDNYMLCLTTDYRMADWETALQEYMDELQ